MNRVCFDSHWMLFCCWLYLYRAFLFFFFAWILTTLLTFASREINSKMGWEKNKTSKIQVGQVNPFPAPSPNHTGQIQTKVTAQEKLWEELRCEFCPLSPSLTNTVDSGCSDLPFLRLLAHSYFAGFVHLHFHARSDNPQKATGRWVPPAGPALRSCCSQRLVRTAPNKDQHHLSHQAAGTHHPGPSAESPELPECLIISTGTQCTGPEQHPGEDKIITPCSKAATLERSSPGVGGCWGLQLRDCGRSSNSNIFFQLQSKLQQK